MKPIKRVLLILPPEFKPKDRPAVLHLNPPLGISYIGAVLEKAGYDVALLDTVIEGYRHTEEAGPGMVRIGLSETDIRQRIAEFRPDVVGISSMFTMYRRNQHDVARIAKSVNPEAFVLMGGAHPTASPGMVMEDPHVDALVLAEGENTIVPLLEALASGRGLGHLEGVAYREEGRVVVRPKKDFVQDLDTLPFPARHLLPMEKYLAVGTYHGSFGMNAMQGRRPASLITSRGCPYQCNFCTAFEVFSRRPRVRSVGNIMAEVDLLIHRFGVRSLFFEDDQFIAKTKHTEEVLDALTERHRKYGITWDTPNGVSVWLLNPRIIQKMKASGCIRVNLAVESGNQFVLDRIIHKPVRVEEVPRIARAVRRAGMEVNTFLVVGNIGEEAVETLDQVRDSFRLARRLRVSPHVSYLTPYPGSAVLDIARRKGYLIPEFSWDKLTITEKNLTTPEWTPQKLEEVVEEERLLTDLWFKLANPVGWLMRLLPTLKGRLREEGLGGCLRYYGARAGQIAGLLLGSALRRRGRADGAGAPLNR